MQILTDFLLFFVILRLFHEGHAEPQMVFGYRGVQLQCLSIFRLFFFQGLGVGASRRKYCATRSSPLSGLRTTRRISEGRVPLRDKLSIPQPLVPHPM